MAIRNNCLTRVTFYSSNESKIKELHDRFWEYNLYCGAPLSDLNDAFELKCPERSLQGTINILDDVRRKLVTRIRDKEEVIYYFEINQTDDMKPMYDIYSTLLGTHYLDSDDMNFVFFAEDASNDIYINSDLYGWFYSKRYSLEVCYPQFHLHDGTEGCFYDDGPDINYIMDELREDIKSKFYRYADKESYIPHNEDLISWLKSKILYDGQYTGGESFITFIVYDAWYETRYNADNWVNRILEDDFSNYGTDTRYYQEEYFLQQTVAISGTIEDPITIITCDDGTIIIQDSIKKKHFTFDSRLTDPTFKKAVALFSFFNYEPAHCVDLSDFGLADDQLLDDNE